MGLMGPMGHESRIAICRLYRLPHAQTPTRRYARTPTRSFAARFFNLDSPDVLGYKPFRRLCHGVTLSLAAAQDVGRSFMQSKSNCSFGR
jgi:hypothetical protein